MTDIKADIRKKLSQIHGTLVEMEGLELVKHDEEVFEEFLESCEEFNTDLKEIILFHRLCDKGAK